MKSDLISIKNKDCELKFEDVFIAPYTGIVAASFPGAPLHYWGTNRSQWTSSSVIIIGFIWLSMAHLAKGCRSTEIRKLITSSFGDFPRLSVGTGKCSISDSLTEVVNAIDYKVICSIAIVVTTKSTCRILVDLFVQVQCQCLHTNTENAESISGFKQCSKTQCLSLLSM